MSAAFTRYVTITTALIFALWIICVWVMPEQKHAEIKKPVVQQTKDKQEVTDKPKAQVLALPAPPAPMKKEAPVAKPVVKKAADPSPVKKAEVKPPVKPQAKLQAKPQPKPASKPTPKKTEPVVHQVSAPQAAKGRALLKVLEHGKGPLIEIAWPSTAQARDRLFQIFRDCYGMESALMDGTGNLFHANDPSGQRWEINLDRYSAFLRQPSGSQPIAERKRLNEIKRVHGNIAGTRAIRVFPRHVDARMLGGLQALIGSGYMNAKNIHAAYQVSKNNIIITDLSIDGKKISGNLALAPLKRCGGFI